MGRNLSNVVCDFAVYTIWNFLFHKTLVFSSNENNNSLTMERIFKTPCLTFAFLSISMAYAGNKIGMAGLNQVSYS